ncbi:MAG: hypothetical protein IJR20_07740 [Muribaculaceae bacterium]|nr:hypothetical protein [Muribaculaceae bacterium]
MKSTKKTLLIGLITVVSGIGISTVATSCNRAITYEDGMFDYDDIYNDDSTNDVFQINSEIENDDQERY